MSKANTTRETVEENELYKAERVTTVRMEYTPNVDKIKAELEQYLAENKIDDGWFKLTDIEWVNSYYNNRKYVQYELVHFTPAHERDEDERDEPDEEWECEIDESFASDDKFDAFVSSLDKKYHTVIDHPSGYTPK